MKIAIVAPEVFPVPPIRGGAVEAIIEELCAHLTGHDPSTRATALAGGPSLGMSPATCRGVVPSEVEGRRSGAPGLPGGSTHWTTA